MITGEGGVAGRGSGEGEHLCALFIVTALDVGSSLWKCLILTELE